MAEDDTDKKSQPSQSDRADAVFELTFEEDENSYLYSDLMDCPEHGDVLPIALPYAHEQDALRPEGYHLVCPRCRYTFDEYEPSNFDNASK